MNKTVLLLSIVLVPYLAFGDGDITVTQCLNNPKLIRVKLSGNSALAIYKQQSITSGLSESDLGGTQGALGGCNPQKSDQNGNVTEVVCSFVTDGFKTYAFPQTDPVYSGKVIIKCED